MIVLAVGAACARGQSDYVGEPGPWPGGPSGIAQGSSGAGSNGAGVDATAPPSGPGGSSGGGGGTDSGSGGNPSDGGTPPPQDSATSDAPFDAGAMDPGLGLPDPNGVPCSRPGFETGCPGITVCRIATPDAGRCEGCTNCGNRDAPCTKSDECDILFQCYQGSCVGICTLGTTECGAISDCIDVGNAFEGVCRN